jgi:uncharacterized protein
MLRDELRQPLRKRGVAERLWAKRPGLLPVAYLMATAAFAGGGFWAVTQPLPFAGEPIVTVSVPPAQEIVTASTAPAEEIAAADIEEIAEEPVSGPETVENDDPSQAGPEFESLPDEPRVAILSGRRALLKAPKLSVMETTNWGPLPRISASGERPSRLYARNVSMNVIHSDVPKIAIVLGGMGLNRKLTEKAIRELPPDVTLAFAPYGSELQEQVDKARDGGHEVFLQVPLEPVGFPANNPGPKTLVGEASEAENLDAMRWHMSRFTGYSGVVNYMGGRFLSMPKALKPVFRELKSRGVLFLEDGALALSSTEKAAKDVNLQVRRAKVVIDADPSPESIRQALQLLEEEAKTHGMAIGTGSGLDVTIDVLGDWMREAEERGVVFIPATASFKGRLG